MLSLNIFSIVLYTLLCTTIAANIPTPANGLTQSLPSGVDTGSAPANAPIYPVDVQENPNWSGTFKADDCRRARGLLEGRVAYYDPRIEWTFWSREWLVIPPSTSQHWELPFGARYGSSCPCLSGYQIQRFHSLMYYREGTCVLLLRMGKDFGDRNLPLEGRNQYANNDNNEPQANTSWQGLLTMADIALNIVQLYERPVWTYNIGLEARYIDTLYLPKSSYFARRWSGDMRSQRYPLGDLLWAANGTGSAS